MVVSTVSNVDHGHVNPISNGEFTIFTPLRPPNLHNNVFVGTGETIVSPTIIKVYYFSIRIVCRLQPGTSQDFVYGDIDVRKWYGK